MLRVFSTTCLVAIDADELDEPKNINLEDVKSHLNDALIVDWNCEDYGNPIGLQSVEVHIDQLQELSQEQVQKLYKKS